MWNHGCSVKFVCPALPPKFEFMNEIRLLVVMEPSFLPVDIDVPSGIMLQVIVAGAPLPEREPLAVVSQGSGSFGLMMKPWAGATMMRHHPPTIKEIKRGPIRRITENHQETAHADRKAAVAPWAGPKPILGC